MAELATVIPDVDGADPGFTAATAGGDYVEPGGARRVLLIVRNTDAAAHTVTVDDPTSQAPAGGAAFDPDVTVSVPAGGFRVILLEAVRFVDDATGRINLTYSAATGMQVAALELA